MTRPWTFNVFLNRGRARSIPYLFLKNKNMFSWVIILCSFLSSWIAAKKKRFWDKILTSNNCRNFIATYNQFVKRCLIIQSVRRCKAFELEKTFELRGRAKNMYECMKIEDVRCIRPEKEGCRTGLCEKHWSAKKTEWASYHRVDFYAQMVHEMTDYEQRRWRLPKHLLKFREDYYDGKRLSFYQAEELHLRLQFKFRYRKTLPASGWAGHEDREHYLREGCKYDYGEVSITGIGPRTEDEY